MIRSLSQYQPLRRQPSQHFDTILPLLGMVKHFAIHPRTGLKMPPVSKVCEGWLNHYRDRSIVWGQAAWRSGGVGSSKLTTRDEALVWVRSYRFRSERSPFSMAARTLSRQCAPDRDHLICCFFANRFATGTFTLASAGDVAIRFPARWRSS